MKALLSALLFLAAVVTAGAQSTDAFTLRVEGLGCPFCAYGLEKKFKDVKGIDDLKIDIQTGEMTFRVPSATALTLAEADARVARAGYTAKGIAVVRADGKAESMGDVATAVAPTPMADAKAKRKVETFEVHGNCGMCKARIDRVAQGVAGVKSADWSVDRKRLTVEFDPRKTSVADVQRAVAAAGHDNAGARAPDAVYDALPACCQYRS